MSSPNPVTPQRGEIWLVNFDPTVGTEIQKTRPAVVVSSDAVGRLPIKLVAPLTDWKEYFAPNIWHVRIDPDPINGLTEYQSVMQQEEQSPIRVAYECRNRDLDPQLVWRGKDEQDWSDLVVHAPPLSIQEKVHPKVLIDDLLKQMRERHEQEVGAQPDLFADFNGIPKGVDKTEFYRHEQNWSNRMILGDSLQKSWQEWEIPREAGDADFDVLIACAFNYDAHSSEFDKLGRIPVLKARMNADLHMAEDLKNTGKGNLFVIFGEPDIDILPVESGQVQVKVNGVDVFHPNTGEVRSDGAEGIACWFIDTDYWLHDVRQANEDTLLKLADHLPSEAAEALLELATSGKPHIAQPVVTGADPFEHPDAQRRFRVMHNVEELERALAYPWEKWTIFLHPAQRQWVERDYGGPARVAGSAGTGKTIVALHRAVFLARTNPDARVLLTTFSDTLAHALRTKLRRLISNEPRLGERLEVHAMNAIGRRLYELHFGRPKIAARDEIQPLLEEAAREVHNQKFSRHFLLTEWEEVVDAWQLDTWEAYRDVRRLGRKTRLPEQQRAVLWSIFARVRSQLASQGFVTYAGLFSRLAAQLADRTHLPFDFAGVDEAQDVSVAQLQFLAALGAGQPNSPFFAGDLGQRICQQPFSWRALGVDIRGRSRTLQINYRTSHQIRMQADRLLGPELSDVDGNTEQRVGTISVFTGPPPTIRVVASAADESHLVGTWLVDLGNAGVMPLSVSLPHSPQCTETRLIVCWCVRLSSMC